MEALDGRILSGGLGDPGREAQRVFRAVLAALSEPGTVRTIPPVAAPPPPLSPAMGALALSLCDADTPVFLDPLFAPAAGWLAFHAGAPVTQERAAARFAFLTVPDLAGFCVGSDTYPDRSATVVAAASFQGGPLVLTGPGIRGRTRQVALSLEPPVLGALAANRALYPRGVDLLLVDGDGVMGLPRLVAVGPARGGGG